jgi:hypothetical protein
LGYAVSSLCVSTWRRRLAKQLLAIAGVDEGQAFSLAERDALFIGSGPLASVRFFDPTVSRLHCRVRAHHDQILVVDFKSECGTFVNGHRIIPYGPWPGEVLRVGQTCLRLVTSGPERPSDKKPEAAPAKVGTAGRTSTVLERQCTPCLRAGRRLSVLLSKTPSVRFGRPIRFRQFDRLFSNCLSRPGLLLRIDSRQHLNAFRLAGETTRTLWRPAQVHRLIAGFRRE